MNNCKSILIVEDDLDIQCALKDALELEGFNVLTASNGKLAIELLATIERPALIFLDIMMPIMDGHEFMKLMKEDVALAPIPVIVTSASIQMTHVEGAHSFIRKPLDLDAVFKIAHEFCKSTSA